MASTTTRGLPAGIIGFLVSFAGHQVYGRREMQRAAGELVPTFPASER